MTRKKRFLSPFTLMAIGMVLLIVLQGLWLRTEYRTVLEAFSRETNMTFRNTLHQMSDSIFFKNMQETDDQNSLAEMNQDKEKWSRQDLRWIFTGDMKGYSTDSIAKYYRLNLNPSYDHLDFTVLEKDFPENYSRQSHRSRMDSMPLTTSFYPFARMLYAIEFQNAQTYLFVKLLPRGGFALFTTALILISFILVYRSLRTQKKLMEQKDHFVGNITHELKTPLASVGVAIEAIKSFDVLKDRNRTIEYLDLASNELNKLSILTDKILNTSVLDYSDEIKQNQASMQLDTIIDEVLTSFKVSAQENNIQLVFEKTGNFNITGNKEHLTQAIYNLVDNAFKYAADGKYIRIALGEQTEQVVFEIYDKGPGIPHEYRQKVFEKFYRIPNGNIHNVKGYGLGLHYVAGVISQHGGKISLDGNPSKGCKIVIKLPKILNGHA